MKTNHFVRLAVCIAAVALVTGRQLVVAQNETATTLQLGSFGARPTVDVRIDGAGPFTFVLDTGSRAMIIDDSLAHQLGLEIIRSQRIGAPGTEGIEANVYKISQLKVGDLVVDSHEMIGIAPSFMQEGAGPRGVISYWVLGRGTTTLDLSKSTLKIDPQEKLSRETAGTVPLTWSQSFPFPTFAVTLAGDTLTAHLDTGSPGVLTVDSQLMGRFPLAGEVKEVGHVKMVGREVVVHGARVDGDATIGGITLHNPEIDFIDRIPGVNVGSGLLRRAILRIDHENDLLSITADE